MDLNDPLGLARYCVSMLSVAVVCVTASVGSLDVPVVSIAALYSVDYDVLAAVAFLKSADVYVFFCCYPAAATTLLLLNPSCFWLSVASTLVVTYVPTVAGMHAIASTDTGFPFCC
jgi:hypothetical protein